MYQQMSFGHPQENTSSGLQLGAMVGFPFTPVDYSKDHQIWHNMDGDMYECF